MSSLHCSARACQVNECEITYCATVYRHRPEALEHEIPVPQMFWQRQVQANWHKSERYLGLKMQYLWNINIHGNAD